jgi:16S rRNA (cytosine967-C5)-methyltransferase
MLKANIETARKELEKEGITSEPTPFSPWGLRLPPGTAIQSLAAFTRGLIEVQDEGSQIAALATDVRPGQQVVDLCAGAGGKTLALAAMMENHGQIHAFDNDARRLKPLAGRVQRAGVRNVQAHVLDGEGEAKLATLKGRCDVVLVDAPCSGSGTWRRDPALPWRLTAERLDVLTQTQGSLLAEAAALLRPGGRIVYVTCSLLRQENEGVIERFLESNKAFEILPYEGLLKDKVRSLLPSSFSSDPRFLQLGPARHGTDGFFVAALDLHD